MGGDEDVKPRRYFSAWKETPLREHIDAIAVLLRDAHSIVPALVN
jgi:hypothetical protein